MSALMQGGAEGVECREKLGACCAGRTMLLVAQLTAAFCPSGLHVGMIVDPNRACKVASVS